MKNNHTGSQGKIKSLLVVVAMLLVVGSYILAYFYGPERQEENLKFRAVKDTPAIQWKIVFPPLPNNEDEIAKTLEKLDKALNFMHDRTDTDFHLLKLISNYRQTSASKEQFLEDFKRLKGLPLDFIGMYHIGGTDKNRIKEVRRIQKQIALMVKTNYNVMWTENFTGGDLVTTNTSWKYIQEEHLAARDSRLRKNSSAEQVKKEEQEMIPDNAAFILLWNSNYPGEIRGADYRPLKAIQQYLMEIEETHKIFGQTPVFSQEEIVNIGHVLSQGRDLYCLRYIALSADHDKKNVLVLGAFHADHIARLMGNFGFGGKIYLPGNLPYNP